MDGRVLVYTVYTFLSTPLTLLKHPLIRRHLYFALITPLMPLGTPNRFKPISFFTSTLWLHPPFYVLNLMAPCCANNLLGCLMMYTYSSLWFFNFPSSASVKKRLGHFTSHGTLIAQCPRNPTGIKVVRDGSSSVGLSS